jgi:type 1 glutamine amidotransferase
MSQAIRVAVVTGGHSFDVPKFNALFRSLDGVDVYVQHMENLVSARHRVKDWYDVILFYSMLGFRDKGKVRYPDKPVQTMDGVLDAGIGVVMLHHAILSYTNWDLWRDMVGLDAESFTGYSHDETMRIAVADSEHPITQGVADWEMVDETYEMGEPDADSHVLLTTDHAACMKTIGWTRQVQNSRVFNLQSGHDNHTWVDENFQAVLLRGIQWVAGRI